MTERRKEEDLEAIQAKAKASGEGEAQELARQVENLRNDLVELGNTVRALAHEVPATAQRSVRETTDRLTRRGQDLAEEVKAVGQQAVDRGSELAKEKFNEFETTVRKNPTTAILVALGLGYIAGLLSRNRS